MSKKSITVVPFKFEPRMSHIYTDLLLLLVRFEVIAAVTEEHCT
jgi:hypothetical protein